jgi:homoserine O-acetyltransferase
MKRLLIFLLILSACSSKDFKSKWINEKAPGEFKLRVETSKGNFEARIIRDLSPMAVDRFYQLVQHGYFDGAVFYRVVPEFVAQFGNSDSAIIRNWIKYPVTDEKPKGSNRRGTISFARDGADTRNVELYINLRDNLRLDTVDFNGVKGFPVIGEVTKGMETVDALYSGFGNATMDKLDLFYQNRKEFMNLFPGLDSISKAYLLK